MSGVACMECGEVQTHRVCQRCFDETVARHVRLMSPDGDTPCQSCGKRRPLVEVTLSGPVTFRVCSSCAVLAIRSTGATSATLDFPVGPDDGGAA